MANFHIHINAHNVFFSNQEHSAPQDSTVQTSIPASSPTSGIADKYTPTSTPTSTSTSDIPDKNTSISTSEIVDKNAGTPTSRVKDTSETKSMSKLVETSAVVPVSPAMHSGLRGIQARVEMVTERCVKYEERYCRNTTNYGVCYSLWHMIDFIDPKWATPELYKVFGKYLLRLYEQAPNIFVYFVRKHAPLYCLSAMTDLARELVTLHNYVHRDNKEFNPYSFLSFVTPGRESEYIDSMEKLMQSGPVADLISGEELDTLCKESKGNIILDRLLYLVPRLKGKILIHDDHVLTKTGMIPFSRFKIVWNHGNYNGPHCVIDLLSRVECLQAPIVDTSNLCKEFIRLWDNKHFEASKIIASLFSVDRYTNIILQTYREWLHDVKGVSLNDDSDTIYLRLFALKNYQACPHRDI